MSQKASEVSLKEFVSETLLSIAEGIEDAQIKLASRGSSAFVNPTRYHRSSVGGERHGQYRPDLEEKDLRYTDPIEFEVAVTVDKTTGVQASTSGEVQAQTAGFLKVIGADVGGSGGGSMGGSREWSDNRVSKIRFTIPMYFPQNDHDHVRMQREAWSNENDQ